MMSHGRSRPGGRLETPQNVQLEPSSVQLLQNSMAITIITSISQLNGILSKDKDKLSVKCSHK